MLKYHPKLKDLARNLRNNSTLTEVLLWNQIKGKKLKGYRFNRQKPIGNYIVDFYCHELKLVVEIDGGSHNSKIDKDKKRQLELEEFGLTLLRFLDEDVKKDLDSVYRAIVYKIKQLEKKKRNPPVSPFTKRE